MNQDINKPQRKGVMYVRMSTDHQRYSIENQASAIRAYAKTHNINLIGSYEDAGKSGLTFDGRASLKRLISEVETGSAPFSIILVLDVSRWGRFQDLDEAAYYEYACRKAGVEIQYIAETFENDGSSMSSIIKNIKRVMAAEYSRELSAKVYAAQIRIIKQGFKCGGAAGYGFRRISVDAEGHFRRKLEKYEGKGYPTDRVKLSLGPQKEIDTVRLIYKLFIEKKMSTRRISESLNQKNMKTHLDKDWTRDTVYRVLVNEKYMGNSLFGRYASKLKGPSRLTPERQWIRIPGAVPQIVTPEVFYQAQKIFKSRMQSKTDEKLLADLKNLYLREGRLSYGLISKEKRMACTHVYGRRFGSLPNAYRLVGYEPKKRAYHLKP